MVVVCRDCGTVYDDAARWTICPHGPLGQPPASYCPKHDLAPCPLCDPTAVNPLVRPLPAGPGLGNVAVPDEL